MLTAIAVFILSLVFLFFVILATVDIGDYTFASQIGVAVLLLMALAATTLSFGGLVKSVSIEMKCVKEEPR